jgi:hypothetical protein
MSANGRAPDGLVDEKIKTCFPDATVCFEDP